MTVPWIDPAERAHMAWECASADDEPVDKETWLRIVAGVARQAAAAEREQCALIADGYRQVAGTAQIVGNNIGHMIRLRSQEK